MHATLAALALASLGEAPRWMRFASAEPALHFTDLLAGQVYRAVGSSASVVRDFPGETVSALIPLRDGRCVVCLHRALLVLTADGSTERRIELDLPGGMRLSDATAGPTGHIWAGVVSATETVIPGMLLRIGDDGSVVVRDRIGFSNGIGFTADGRSLIHIDSAEGTLSAIDHDPVSGELGATRVLYRHPVAEEGLDGLALDADDRIWVAVFGRGEVLCFSAEGDVLSSIHVPAKRVTSCAFRGTRLMITTARVDASVEELEEFPLSGSLFSYELGVAGGPVWEGSLS